MVLLLDNYDSFTFNLAQYLGELGAEVVVRRNDAVTLDDIAGLRPRGLSSHRGRGVPKMPGFRSSWFGASEPRCRSWASAWGTRPSVTPLVVWL